jgi:hypothetical protein
MNYSQVVDAAQAMIEQTGLEARMNALEGAVKSRILRAYPWEVFMDTMAMSWGGSNPENLATNAYREIYRIFAIRFTSIDRKPPDYITPIEYNRLVTTNLDAQTNLYYWTQIERGLYLLGIPSAGTSITVTYQRSPDNIGWGEISEEFLDFASTVLARMVTPAATEVNGQPTVNPAYAQFLALEKEARLELIDTELRQPGRAYQLNPEEMRLIRNEEFDY